MKALILAAGYATRLYPLTKKRPKALLPVAGRPIIERILEKITAADKIKEVVIITNAKFFARFQRWVNKYSGKKKHLIRIVSDGTKSENDRLGAVGDINYALEKTPLNDDLIIFGGDNLFEDDLSLFFKNALKNPRRALIGVCDIKDKRLAVKYGVVEKGRGSIILNFSEKPKSPKTSLVATCLYYIPKEKITRFKEYLTDSRNQSDTAGSFIKWLSVKEAVRVFVFKKRWFDIGDPLVYKEADARFNSLDGSR